MDRGAVRKQHITDLRNILTALGDGPNAGLKPDELSKLNVKVSSLDLQTGQTDDDSFRFASPFPKDEFDGLFKSAGVSEHDWPLDPASIAKWTAACTIINFVHYYLDEPERPESLASHSPWFERFTNPKSAFETLHNLTPYMEWQCRGILETRDRSLPHFACVLDHILYPGTVLDDSLLRSEILYGAAAMAGRLASKRYTNLSFHPIIIFSHAGPRARVIQMHYEYPHFVVRKSPVLDFEKYNPDALKLMLRWLMNKPEGENAIFTKNADVPSLRPKTV